jgi:xanthosine utilization system XapX-like protein
MEIIVALLVIYVGFHVVRVGWEILKSVIVAAVLCALVGSCSHPAPAMGHQQERTAA